MNYYTASFLATINNHQMFVGKTGCLSSGEIRNVNIKNDVENYYRRAIPHADTVEVYFISVDKVLARDFETEKGRFIPAEGKTFLRFNSGDY
ncbi:MAG: hypothetical protein ABUT20_39265 [Bacteroidota bacterium]